MNRKTLERIVTAKGGTFEAERQGRTLHIGVMAPKGHHWKRDQVHEMVTESDYGLAEWHRKAYREAIYRLSDDTAEPCTADTCPAWDSERASCQWWCDDDRR